MFTKREYGRIGELAFYDTLESGLRLIVVPKRDFRRSLAFLAVNYGGADRRFRLGGNEYETPAGVAHFLEHKTFETEDGSDAMSIMGARGANVNAFTASDMTAYHFDCVEGFQHNLETLLSFVSKPHFTDESVEREKAIIAQEIKMGEDDPDHRIYYNLLRSLYRHHPLRDPVVGTAESISGTDAELLRFCHSSFYVPANMCLVVVGDQDPIRVRTAAERILPKERIEPPEVIHGPIEGEKPYKARKSEKMDVAETMFLAGIKTGAAKTGEDGVRFDLTAALALNSLMSEASPLYSRLYSAGLINETFSYDFEVSSGVSFLSFGGETAQPERVIGEVISEAERVSREGFDEGYFSRRKKAAMGDELRALNSFDNIAYNCALGAFNGYDYFTTAPIMRDISSADAAAFVGTYFKPERLAVSVAQKKEAE